MDIRSIFRGRRAASGFSGMTCRRMWRNYGWLSILWFFAGCAQSPIAGSWRQAASNQPPFAEISAAPHSFMGQKVVLGGEVARTSVRPPVTEIEIRQIPVDSSGRPAKNSNAFQGRFLVRWPGVLNPADYFRGRLLTVAGEIRGLAGRSAEIRPLGAFRYAYPAVRYPVIDCRQIHLWPKRRMVPDVYVPPYEFGPYGWRGTSYTRPHYYRPLR